MKLRRFDELPVVWMEARCTNVADLGFNGSFRTLANGEEISIVMNDCSAQCHTLLKDATLVIDSSTKALLQ